MTCSKELQNYLKKRLNYTVLVKYCLMAISRNSNRFLMGIERRLSQKGIIKVYQKIFQFQLVKNETKRIRINLLMKQKIHAATVRTAFP